MEEEIRNIRELELAAMSDIKNINNIKSLVQVATDENRDKKVRTASIHSLRRLFLDYLENEKLPSASDEASTKVKTWFTSQYSKFVTRLCDDAVCIVDWIQALSIRTLLELVKVDHKVQADQVYGEGIGFGFVCYRELLTALITSTNDLDIDLLLMLKDEIFQYHDCSYFALVIIKEAIEEMKAERQESSQTRKNILDMMRVITVPDSPPEDEDYLVPLPSGQQKTDAKGKPILDDEESSDEEERKKEKDRVTNKRKLPSSIHSTQKKAKLSNHTSINQKLRSVDFYKQAFASAWLSTLSLGYSPAEHKLILKHLPNYVMPYMPNPLLLADYLTTSYQIGGMTAVLALESLFQLIVKHNLDYPHFFLSLYKLCTVAIFNAKYHGRFLKLLHMSLRSVNLPSYLVAAFIKRLAGLALNISAPSIYYCLLQIQWLLKHHQQCLPLLHNEKDVKCQFNIYEDKDLEKAKAMQSSLWELELLEQHYLYDIAKLAASFRNEEATAVVSAPTVIDDSVVNKTYTNLIEESLNQKKKLNVGMSYKKVEKLFDEESLLGRFFTL